jgi:hypothetical protein
MAVIAAFLLSSMIGLIPYQQHKLHLTYYAEGGSCIDYDQTENTITMTCDASFLDVVDTVNDQSVLEELGDGEYLLNANK